MVRRASRLPDVGAGNLASLQSSVELVELLDRIGCRRTWSPGPSAEYRPVEGLLTEGCPIAPWSVYGATKAAVHLLLDSSLAPDLTVVWARLFNVTGPGEHPDRLFPWVLREVQAGRRVALTSGSQLRDYLDVTDVAAAIAQIGESDVAGPVNVASGEGRSLRQLIERLVPTGTGRDLLDFGARPHDDTIRCRWLAITAVSWTRDRLVAPLRRRHDHRPRHRILDLGPRTTGHHMKIYVDTERRELTVDDGDGVIRYELDSPEAFSVLSRCG